KKKRKQGAKEEEKKENFRDLKSDSAARRKKSGKIIKISKNPKIGCELDKVINKAIHSEEEIQKVKQKYFF
ncbi:hypothetical protein, partial [Clostridium sp. ZBS18]|uniref:hypothetical protein n=1 Tax=Clostridium sp. ZBS18 TaxID=2949967 RepID=UPI00207A0D05